MKKILFSSCFLMMTCYSFAQDNTKTVTDTLSRVFTLGQITVTGNRNNPIFSVVSASQMQSFAKNDVAKAMSLMPGVTLSAVGPRNESMVFVRGFDLRQVPILIDGIPVYVPYDGYVDLARFTTFDLSEIQVSKDYTSVNYGPNAMGGAINLITRKPVTKLELSGATGWQSGGFRSSLNIASNMGKFYLQAGLSKYKRDYFPLSKNFDSTKTEDGGHRNNSYNDDSKINIKVAYTPNARSEYALSYIYQHGDKGTPVYTGTDTLNSLFKNPRFWQWPKWDKQSLYFLSNTSIDSMQYIKTRLYYDKFINTLNSYDDATYSAMTRPYAFSSLYDDYTLGGIVEYGKNFSNKDNIIASVQYKQDVHREHNVGEPERTMSDRTITVGLENQFLINKQFTLLTGLSFNNRASIKAQNYDGQKITDYPSNNNSAFNLQGALQYSVNADNIVSLSVARKTRFATTKDRYSYRMGTAIPNPDLEAEYTVNYNLSYKGNFVNNHLKLNGAVFFSDINNTILMVANVAVDPVTNRKLSQLQNVGKSQYTGFELGANYRVISPLTIGANYTYINRKNKTNPGIYFTDVPRNKLFGFVQYAMKNIFSVQANAEYNSDRYSTSYGTVNNAFTLVNSSATVHVWKWFSVEAGINNIFDKNYSLAEGFPEAGRNCFVNLVYRY